MVLTYLIIAQKGKIMKGSMKRNGYAVVEMTNLFESENLYKNK